MNKRKQHKNRGWTTFAPLKIIPTYKVEKSLGQVTGEVIHNNKLYLTVVINVHTGKITTKGSIRKIHKHTKPFKKRHYIELIKNEAINLINSEE